MRSVYCPFKIRPHTDVWCSKWKTEKLSKTNIGKVTDNIQFDKNNFSLL